MSNSNSIIDLNNYKTWPGILTDYLEERTAFFEKFCGGSISYRDSGQLARVYDQIVVDVKSILRPYKILGYHCCRLTELEIDAIKTEGMFLPNPTTLLKRVEKLVETGVIGKDVAHKLIKENDAADQYRRDILWFCFFQPYIASESGIGSFFRFWGGEALFRSHEDNIITGPILKQIGTPAIVEASLPLKDIDLVETKFVKKFMIFKKLQSHEDHEGYIVAPLQHENIINIITHPSVRFYELTKCQEWDIRI